MSLLNIPIEILFGILIFTVPLLGRLYGRLRQRQQRQQDAASTRSSSTQSDPATRTPPTRIDRPLQTEANTGTLSAPTSSSSSTSTPRPNVSTDTARWLEEAQRRVREAQQTEDDRRSRGSVNPRTRPQTPVQTRSPTSSRNPAPTRSQPQARPLEGKSLETRPPATRSVEARSLETRDVTPRRNEARSLETFGTEAQSLEASRGSATVTLDTAPPLTVQRLGDDRRARMVSPELRFDEREIARGLIWHQILSPPLSQRRTRLSRPRP